MPDRIVRDELLESKRWLSLKDNADRLAYIALLLKADSLGNFTAEPFRLMRLWRDFGINNEALVTKCLSELADQDLIRLYERDGKTLLHIPRFGQRNMRYIKRVFPISPWITTEQKQKLAGYSQREHSARTVRARSEIREDKRREDSTKTPLSADFCISDRVRRWAEQKDIRNLQAHFEFFVNQAKAKGYRYVDWDRAFMNAILHDWAKIGTGQKKVAL